LGENEEVLVSAVSSSIVGLKKENNIPENCFRDKIE